MSASSAYGDDMDPITAPLGTTTAVAAAAVGQPLFLNLGPVPSGVRVGVNQTVFQFVHAGSPTGPVVQNMPVHFDVIEGANKGRRGVIASSTAGEAIFRYATTATPLTTGTTDTVSAWIDLNDNAIFDNGEPANVNPFFTLPAQTIDGKVACNGRPATAVLSGSKRTLSGSGGPDVVAVFSDNARVYGNDGDDTVCSWGQNTTVFAGNGNDRVLMESGAGMVYGNDGDDYIQTNAGNSVIYGSNGNDSVVVGDGDNTVWGGAGDDNLFAGTGKTQLSGDGGNDRVTSLGEAGTYWGGSGWDAFDIAGRRWNA